MSVSPINLVVALPAEAKPITSGFGLKRVSTSRGFPLYRNRRTALVISAPGKINSAAATAHLEALGDGTTDSIWVNVGVAGHAERQVGEALLAHQITDGSTGRCWRVVQPPDECYPSDSLVTLDRPDLSYKRNSMVDMEASGFYPTARRFSPAELVQTLKVISDNRNETARGLSAKQVQQLIEGALDTLEALITLLETGNSKPRQPKRIPSGL